MTSRLIVRMTAPVVVMSLLLLVVGVGAAWYVDHLQHRVSDELKANVSSLRAAEELVIALHEIRARLDRFLISGDRAYLKSVPPLRERIDRWAAEAERWGTASNEQEMMKRVRKGQERFFTELDRLLAEPATPAKHQIQDLIENALIREQLNPAQNYLSLNATESEESIHENQVFATRLVYVFLFLGTCGSGVGLIAGFGFARAFQRSLVQLSLPIRAAAGHLHVEVGPITFSANADLHEMESTLRLIAERTGVVVERLRETEREVLRAEQLAAVGQMAAGMAHELRNPLTSMKILVQAALAGDRRANGSSSPGLAGRDLFVLEEEITRLERLVHSFLQYAQPPQLEKRVQDVKHVVEETVGLLAHRAAVCMTRIEMALPQGEASAAIDAVQFKQVLLNLLLNALDATKSDGTIWVRLQTELKGAVRLSVADTGCGLPAALGNRIFAPFVTTKQTGLGLGLSISKRIIEAHGGEITAADRAEGGAVFTIVLPGTPEPGCIRTENLNHC